MECGGLLLRSPRHQPHAKDPSHLAPEFVSIAGVVVSGDQSGYSNFKYSVI